MSDDSLEGGKEDANGQCMFQFWVDRVESFYCQLDGCRWDLSESYSEFTQDGDDARLIPRCQRDQLPL
jgi:hypothetical protein